MGFKFTSQKLLDGLFEPEGIYLAPPFEDELPVAQTFGECPEFYGQWRYNGVPLKGHPGIDVLLAPGARIFAMDAGKVTEISVDRGGFERYLKIEHRWGDSFYAHTGEPLVEAGQSVARGEPIATAALPDPGAPAASRAQAGVLFHFAIRVSPFNRYDGWGGFADPLPYLPPGAVYLPDALYAAGDELGNGARATLLPHPLSDERPGVRRP